jgi:hypothetical protein
MEDVDETADTMTESPKKQVHLSMIVILKFIAMLRKNTEAVYGVLLTLLYGAFYLTEFYTRRYRQVCLP